MAVLLFAVLILAVTGHSSATWCVCKDGLSDAVLQKTLDYACGAAADCNPIHNGAPCFQPNTVRAHCSYAVNSYFQKKGQAQGTCDFSGTAIVSPSDPSVSGCAYPSSLSGSGTTPVNANTPTTINGVNPTNTSPYSTTPPSTGISPSGNSMNNDYSDGGFRLLQNTNFFVTTTLLLIFSGLMLLWGR